MTRAANRIRSFRRLLAAGLIGLGLSASAASAATVSYVWTIVTSEHSISGWFTGLLDNTSGQSVTAVGIFASTVGGIDIYDVADADKNEDFELSNGQILEGRLKFHKIGAKTVASPEISLELKWKNGEIKTAKFEFDNGLSTGDFKLDFKKDSGVFTVSEPLDYIPIYGYEEPPLPVPVPAAALLTLSGLATFALMLHWQRRRRALAT